MAQALARLVPEAGADLALRRFAAAEVAPFQPLLPDSAGTIAGVATPPSQTDSYGQPRPAQDLDALCQRVVWVAFSPTPDEVGWGRPAKGITSSYNLLYLPGVPSTVP